MTKTIGDLMTRGGQVVRAAAADETTTPEGPTRPFETLMCVEGRWTGDDRIIMVDGLSWDGMLPMCLTIDHEGVEQVVGRVDEIARTPGATDDERYIFGKGEMFLGSELGLQVEQLIDGQFLRGVSVELDAIEIGGVDPEDPALDDPDDAMWMMVAEKARLRALSVVTTPAFAEAYITFGSLPTEGLPPALEGPTPLAGDDVPATEDDPEEIIIVAAGHTITIPSVPPAEWFAEPTDVEIEGALTVTDDGRVYGLLAPAGVPFMGDPRIPGVPMGNVDYSRYLRGEAIVEGGARVVAGNITMGCGHAKGSTTAAAMEHHENSCAVVAQVNVGERQTEPRGVWVAGALLPGVSEDQVQRMMACQLSGEWYPTPSGGYELVNALLVPVPAFAMGRRAASVTARHGRLVASAIPVQFEHEADCGCGDCPEGGSTLADVDKAIVGEVLLRLDKLEARLNVLAPLELEQLRSDMTPR